MNQVKFNRSDGLNAAEFHKKSIMLHRIKYIFTTFGYSEIETPTFESYDVYQSIIGTVDRDSMVKVIDPSGKILVMRPDVTIPITKMQVSEAPITLENQRLFYTENVFRLSEGELGKKEWTQAGIENFAPSSVETDAEVIALAVRVLRSMKLGSIQVQVGLASFFRTLLEQVSLTIAERKELLSLVRAKNISEMELFLTNREVPENLLKLLLEIPYLYGEFNQVVERAKSLPLNDSMKEEIEKLEALHHMLKIYDVESYVSLDLGLINHMDYYSGIIFQGFIENVGKPVLMGGRYDKLAAQIGETLPAIGFACEVDVLLDAIAQKSIFESVAPPVDAVVVYEWSRQKEAIQTGDKLRKDGLRIIVTAQSESGALPEGTPVIRYAKTDQVIEKDSRMTPFYEPDNLSEILKRNKEEM
ncbi:ATP phosphoribosyltransferase regulatory subunit [Virgibacillus flavescens]|uniref:ATP phosphoribosyltransferase regulatory subunit n=1 Tax=Virgibacillus flavescens TaxID=1611422 RepID=UPI003D3457DF